jgi:hypothetical protein
VAYAEDLEAHVALFGFIIEMSKGIDVAADLKRKEDNSVVEINLVVAWNLTKLREICDKW